MSRVVKVLWAAAKKRKAGATNEAAQGQAWAEANGNTGGHTCPQHHIFGSPVQHPGTAGHPYSQLQPQHMLFNAFLSGWSFMLLLSTGFASHVSCSVRTPGDLLFAGGIAAAMHKVRSYQWLEFAVDDPAGHGEQAGRQPCS